MKKIIIMLLVLGISSAQAQKIYNTLELYNETPKESFYVFLKADADLVDDLINQYASNFGSYSNGMLEWKETCEINEDISTTYIQANHLKSHSKISFFFMDQNQNDFGSEDLDRDQLEDFIYDLYYLILNEQEKALLSNDLSNAQEVVDKQQREVKRLKKSLERNLRDQEKLGKKLDATPEQLANLVEEKNNVLQDKLEMEVAPIDSTTNDLEVLNKKIDKKEKAIVKKQKESSKNEEKLARKEEQFEELSTELLEAQKVLRNLEKVLLRKKTLMTME